MTAGLDTPRHRRVEAVLVYDGECGFCRWAVEKVIAWDRGGRIRSLAVQDPEAESLLASVDPLARTTSWHLAMPDGRVYSAGAAAPPLLRLLPGGTPLAVVLGRFPRATERAYRAVASNRDRVGRAVGAACALPSAALRRRRDE